MLAARSLQPSPSRCLRPRQRGASDVTGTPPDDRANPILEAAGRDGAKLAGDRTPLVQIDGLKTYYPIRAGILRRVLGHVHAVDGVSFEIRRGEIFGLVGESGCGKTTLGRTLLRLEQPTAGAARFENEDIFSKKGKDLKKLRRRMQVIFQDPVASLNPRMPVSDIIGEGMLAQATTRERLGRPQGPRQARRRLPRGGRSAPRVHPPLPARVLRWPAPADRHRPGARALAGIHLRRRAGVRPRRLDPVADPQPPARTCASAST